MEFPELKQLGLALLLGLLVGLQRQHAGSAVAGVRTFPLITVLGTVCGLLGQQFGGWIVAAGFVAAGAVVTMANFMRTQAGDPSPGSSTEFAILLMYAVGAYIVVGSWVVASAIGGGVAVLLQFKPELHGLAARLGDEDLKAIMRFVLISFIILPALPNETFGPLDVLNLREVWLMVVLIVGISLGGYIAYKFLGDRAGVILGGLLGGAISSTATTVSYSRRTAQHPDAAPLAAVVVTLASAVVFVRVLIEIGVVAPAFAPIAAAPIGAMAIATVAPALLAWRRARERSARMPEQGNPTEMRAAMAFAALYAIVLAAMAAVKEYIGSDGLFAVAALSGLTDMDAITLSTSRMVTANHIDAALGWQIIVVAALSNLAFKAGVVAVLGDRRLLRQVLTLWAAPFAIGLAWVVFSRLTHAG